MLLLSKLQNGEMEEMVRGMDGKEGKKEEEKVVMTGRSKDRRGVGNGKKQS